LEEFDKYISLLEDMDREQEEELWKLGLMPGMLDMVDSETANVNEVERKETLDKSDPPKFININTQHNGDIGDSDNRYGEDSLSNLLDSNHDDALNKEEQQAQLTYPFNHKFWSYFRSILEHAKPKGFTELEDSNATMSKGPEDATAFISKVIAIKSINPIQPAVLAKEGGFDENEVLAELLYATSVGLVAMRFAPECVQCGSAVMDTDMLGRVPNRANCNGCNAPNTVRKLCLSQISFWMND
jgi:hypothetical protein